MQNYSLENEITNLSQHYLRLVFPFESLCEAISLQETELEDLDQQYHKLLACPALTQEEKDRLQAFQFSDITSKRQESNKWLCESIQAKKHIFNGFYPQRKAQLQEQIDLKSKQFSVTPKGSNCLSSLQGTWEPVRWIFGQVGEGNLDHKDTNELLQTLKMYDKKEPGQIGDIIEGLATVKKDGV